MKPQHPFYWIVFPLVMLLAILACTLPARTPAPVQPIIVITQNVTVESQSQSPPTEPTQPPQQPAATAEVIAQDTATASPSCTVVQDINLRSGPGTAYRPPITSIPANTIVTPLGYVSEGIPGGTWAYVQDSLSQKKGWVSAGSEYISCNVDVTAMSEVAFNPPPAPAFPKSAQNSDPDGNGFCLDPTDKLKCFGIFSNESLFEFQVTRKGKLIGENEGVEFVSFTVKKDGDEVYSSTENNAAYCIFGGDGPCNNWVSENGVYKWTPGGTPVESGEYEVEAQVTVNGEDSLWSAFFIVTLP